MRDGEEISVRFVSPRGSGGWNSCKYSPIAFDIDRSGFVEHIDGEFEIDITGDGDMEFLSQRVAPSEGILVDAKEKNKETGIKDNDNTITGQHLIGDMGGQYTDGFAKLKEYDDNGDGIVDGKELKGFYIWVDKDSNARLDDGELTKIEKFDGVKGKRKIVALDISYENYKSTATLDDGSDILMEDLWFPRR